MKTETDIMGNSAD